jgi:hypothetical protein
MRNVVRKWLKCRCGVVRGKSAILLESSQVWPTRPSDMGNVEVKPPPWLKAVACDNGPEFCIF